MVKCIAYRGGYKYQLRATYQVRIPLQPPAPIATPYIKLALDGTLVIENGYAWDGPSGPTIDTRNFMRGSLVHDALYQLMRERHLDRSAHRETADRILQSMCKEDGMSSIRAWWVYQAVRQFGDPAANPADDRPTTYAPDGCQR